LQKVRPSHLAEFHLSRRGKGKENGVKPFTHALLAGSLIPSDSYERISSPTESASCRRLFRWRPLVVVPTCSWSSLSAFCFGVSETSGSALFSARPSSSWIKNEALFIAIFYQLFRVLTASCLCMHCVSLHCRRINTWR